MMVNGKQSTICWYIYDTKISHEDSTVVDSIIHEIEPKMERTVRRGENYSFIGVDIEFMSNGMVSLSLDKHVNGCVKIYGGDVKYKATKPAKGSVFDENKNDEMTTLDRSEGGKFHHTVDELLYLAKGVRIYYTYTWDKQDKKSNWDEYTYLQTWINVSYVTEKDMHSHMGSTISMDRGVVIYNCSKHKIKTKSL